MRASGLVYDWNTRDVVVMEQEDRMYKHVQFDDETLRDGLQSPSAKNPAITQKIQILHLMNQLGIHAADIGYPSSSEQAYADVLTLAKEIVDNKLGIAAGCAARTVKVDIDPIIEISQKTGLPIEVQAFIGSSPIRCYVEGWDVSQLLKSTKEAVDHVVKQGLDVMYVTEDTTRSNPQILRQLYIAAIEHGAKRICLCDTVGHATPEGVRKLISFIQKVVEETGQDILIDWHGHNDRALSVINSIVAIKSGVDRVHATALGLGERAGNTPMDLLLVNLKLLGIIDQDLTKLNDYCQLAHKEFGAPLPDNYPVVGKDAFRTATGVHAAAIIKAYDKEGDVWLRDAVYSAVPACWVGREQEIEIGPMSGRANVISWLNKRGCTLTTTLVEKILDAAKRSNRVLTDEDIERLIKE